MNIHLPFDEKWSQQNKILQTALGLADDPRFSVQIYTSISHALLEVCYSLSDLIPHKKTITHFKSIGPDFDSVAVSLSKRELTLKSFSRDEILKPEYLVSLSKELLLLVSSFDDPILANRHDFSFLDEQLKEKKYFHIKVSHFLHFSEPVKLPTHYEVLILPLTADRTLVIGGERAKIRPDMTPKMHLNWDAQSNLVKSVQALSFFETGRNLNPAQEVKLKANSLELRKKVLEFESDLPKGISALHSTQDRVFDRSVLFCEGVDGLSLVSKLAETYQGEVKYFETTSLCRWQDIRFFEYLLAQGHSAEKLRGLILIDAEILGPQFKVKLGKVHQDLLAEQNEVLEF